MRINIIENKCYYDILLEKRLETEFNTSGETDTNTTNFTNGRIRIYDGENWYIFNYVDTCLKVLKTEVKGLIANYAVKNEENILKHKKIIGYEDIKLNEFPVEEYLLTSLEEKIKLLQKIKSVITLPSNLYYHDLYMEKCFITEDIERSYNLKGYGIGIKTEYCGKSTFYNKTYNSFEELVKHQSDIIDYCNKYTEQIKTTCQLKEGKYSAIFAPEVTGILVHECFGHIFEADVRYDNDIGERLSNHKKLSVYDNGRLLKIGYCPFDDDGIIKTVTPIIEKGVIAGYLSDRQTALNLGIFSSGNGRCVKLTQKPISRMTNTYMAPTELQLENIFGSFNGIYFITAEYGEINNEGELAITPVICRVVKNGVIGEYVKVSEIRMDINNIFNSIELIGNDLDFSSTLFGGCGKEDQYPLLVSQGGPHILINGIYCK